MERIDFKGTLRKQSVDLYTLSNDNGMKASITNYGGRIVELQVPDQDGNFDNIIVGYSSMKEFMANKPNYFGAVLGRYANRIANGRFKLDDKEYQLEKNKGSHHLHGGPAGFHQAVWGANQTSDQTLNLSYRSPDGEGGYPGNLGVSITYELTDDNELRIKYRAESDEKTILNVSNHAYFNLHGIEDGSSVDDHELWINADQYTPVDKTLIPTGEIKSVSDSPLDFRELKPIGRDKKANHEQIKYCGGYDHNFVLNKEKEGEKSHAASVRDPKSRRQMDVYTTEPGMQFYENKNPVEGIDASFCLETQHYPDSPNKPDFPSVVINRFDPYESETIYRFTCY